MTTAYDDAFAGKPLVAGDLLCRWCTHVWHGLPCSDNSCWCESTTASRDDSWRPRLAGTYSDRAKVVMHETGVDGWVAQLVVIPKSAPGSGSLMMRVRAALYGRTA